MPFDVDFFASFAGSGGGGTPGDGGSGFEQMVFSDPPTLDELERLYRERWHTRPDWMVTGITPKVVGVDPLPAGAVYDAGSNLITIASGVTVDDFSGWDFLATQTTILMSGTARILSFENNRMAPPYTTRANRVAQVTGGQTPVCLRFTANATARIDRMARCLFTQHPLHEGVGNAASFVLAQTTGSNTTFTHVGVMEFCSFEGYDADAIKGAWAGVRRYCYVDAARNMPNDATEWDDTATYNTGDVVWGNDSSKRIRLCLNNNVTSTPNFSGALSSTADWLALDPHSDGDQPSATPQNDTVEWLGSVFVRDCFRRRFPSRQWNRGVVNALRYIANSNSQNIGPVSVRYCLFSDEVEVANSNSPAIALATPDRSYSPLTPKTVEFNWYQTNLTTSSGSHITVRNNISDWQFPAPASLSAITTSYGTLSQTISYGFTASTGGWMRVVVTGSATPLTAAEIVHAREGDAGVLAMFEIDAQANIPATGATSLALSTGQTVHVHALYQAGGGVDTLPPVQSVTEGAGVQNPFVLNALDFDGYVFDGTGQGGTAPVILSGEGPAGEQIQCRGENAGGNTSWYDTTVAADGTWEITMDVPQTEWNNWYIPAARVGQDDGTKLTGSNSFGCGHVAVILGQSELLYFTSDRGSFSQMTRELAAENLTFISDEDLAFQNTTTPRTHRITNANLANANVGLLALANAFRHAVGDDRKLAIVKATRGGTSPFQMWDDANTGRSGDVVKAVIAKARASGSEIGAVIMNWYNAPAATVAHMLFNWAPGLHGRLGSGATFTLGTTHSTAPTTSARGDVDFCLWDADADPNSRGRGLFARARTKLHLMLPMPFNDISGAEDTVFDETKRMTNDERAGIVTFASDPTVQSYLGGVGPGAHLACFDQEDSGTVQGIHPNRFDPLGIPWFANQHLPALLRAAGEPVGEPEITGATLVNATTVDLSVSLPNGGTLTTLAALGVGNHPASTTEANIPHLQDVVGFQINRAAGTKRPLYNNTGGATELPLYRGTVTISDTGTGSGATRTGTVRIIFNQAISSGDQLTYLDGQANAVLDGSRDEIARLFNFMLLEHVPGWSDAGSLYPHHGVPVRPQPSLSAF